MNASCIYLSLGSNLGNRSANLHLAQDALHPYLYIVQSSSIYETEPWGYKEQPPFLNQVLKVEASLSPLDLLSKLKQIELDLGRVQNIRYGPRLIDLDILFYDDLILDLPKLTIPHPQLHQRAFVLVPLAEISPELIHPVLGKTIIELLQAIDAQGVCLYQPESTSSE